MVLKQIVQPLNVSVKFVSFHHERYRKRLLIEEIFFVLKASSNIQVSDTLLHDYTLRWVLYDMTPFRHSAPFSITVRSINILELSTNRFKHVVTLRVLLDNPETIEAVTGTDQCRSSSSSNGGGCGAE